MCSGFFVLCVVCVLLHDVCVLHVDCGLCVLLCGFGCVNLVCVVRCVFCVRLWVICCVFWVWLSVTVFCVVYYVCRVCVDLCVLL